MTDREVMQQALEALEKLTIYDSRPSSIWRYFYPSATGDYVNLREFKELSEPIVNALKAALAQPEQEPVAWANLNELTEQFNSVNCGTVYRLPDEVRSPLYTYPQQHKSLTEEDIEDEWESVTGHNISHGDRQEGRAMYISPDEVTAFARAVIAKVTGEKE